MRVMAWITIPVESGNQAVHDGTLVEVIQQAAERWKPEATYYTTFHGKRTAIIVFDLPNASAMLPFTEPFFAILNAEVLIAPAMSGADLQDGLSADSQAANLPPVGGGRNPDVVRPPRGRRW